MKTYSHMNNCIDPTKYSHISEIFASEIDRAIQDIDWNQQQPAALTLRSPTGTPIFVGNCYGVLNSKFTDENK
jgi:hypothetical protein